MHIIERLVVGDCQRQVMQPDIPLAIEGACTFRIADLPERDQGRAVGNEMRRLVGHASDSLVAQRFAEEAAGGLDVGHGKSDMVRSECFWIGQGKVSCSQKRGRSGGGRSLTGGSGAGRDEFKLRLGITGRDMLRTVPVERDDID